MEDTNEIVVNAFTDVCPCGSGRLLINCCVTSRFNTTPPTPKTNFSNPKCYARSLNDCSYKMSVEHFISKSVMSIFWDSKEQIILEGPTWLTGEENRRVSINSLGSKVLCERHNKALSYIDEIGKLFFQYILAENVQSRFLMINGGELERWMLKVLCGYISSGNLLSNLKQWQPPNHWLQILFGSDVIPNGSGLYVLRGKDISTPIKQIKIWAIESNQKGIFNGLLFIIAGFQFLFFMDSPRRDIPVGITNSGWQMRYKPECLVIIYHGKQREIHFGPPPRGGYVVIKLESPKR